MTVTEKDQELAKLELAMLDVLRQAQPRECPLLSEATCDAIGVAYARVSLDRAIEWFAAANADNVDRDVDAPLPSADAVLEYGELPRGWLRPGN